MKIEINGVAVNYHQSGEGNDVVLLHGWGQNIEMFMPVHKHLEKHFRVTTIDFPGFGDSDEPPTAWDVNDYTVMLERFLSKLNITNPILVGHSFGGRVSIYYSSRNPVRKVILVDSAGVKPKRKLNYYVRVYSFKLAKQLLKLPGLRKDEAKHLEALRKRFGSSDYRSASPVMQQSMVKVVNEDLQFLMPKMAAPTLLVWGENDTATPVGDAKIMEKLIPDAGLVVLKDCGHYAYLEKLGEFLVIVDHFLKNDREVKR
ncbi:MAG: alpha/beta fold hydrolase [Bacilli bacterium]